MAHASPSSSILKICQEAALFDSKDRLLNFSTKGEFQTPLMLEAGDLFYEKWKQSEVPMSLDDFLKVSANFTEQQKMDTKSLIVKALEEKSEDFNQSDLYMVLGFLKWDGNALAPSLLVPVDVDVEHQSLKISSRAPIENIILKERLKDKAILPTTEDATINGEFSILLYFSLFEKAIVQERTWKFTRHGVSLAFFNTDRLRLKKNFTHSFDEKKIDASPFFQSLLGPDGFQVKESIFEDANIDEIFNPADHHFLYPTDSHTTKVAVDAMQNGTFAYAIQTLPGTQKMKVSANIVAEAVCNKLDTLVVARRAVSMQDFNNHWNPEFRSFDGPERSVLEKKLRDMRKSLANYHTCINEKIRPSDVSLATILSELTQTQAPKAKFPDKLFKSLESADYNKYIEIRDLVKSITSLYFNEKGIEARKAFMKVKVPSLSDEQKKTIAQELSLAAQKTTELKPLVKLFEGAGLFPTGIYLSALDDIIDLIQKNFDEKTPTYEQWELRSSNWLAYQDSLKALPEAGDKWVRYRRQASETYTEAAVDENILEDREEFAESLKATLKGLSEHYRSSRKRLLRLFKNPKSISTDAELLNLVDSLIELQEDKRAYKDTSVLGNHLLGRDWLFEKSNWIELNTKITYLYEFRERQAKNPRLDLLLQILEQWHQFKELQPKFKDFAVSVKELQKSIHNISRTLALETPLESQSIESWLDEIQSWNANWTNLDVHLSITAGCNKLTALLCPELASYLSDTDNVNKDIASALSHYWCASQLQQAKKLCPDLFSLSPKERIKKGQEYRTLMDQFCNANFRDFHNAIKTDPTLLTVTSLSETLDFNRDIHFDLAIILDADCITIAEALPILYSSDKVIFIGDAHMPALEQLKFDAYTNVLPRHTTFFQESIFVESLRRGIPTRELRFTDNYSDPAIVAYANDKIYSNNIKQFPRPSREKPRCESIKVVQDKIVAIAKAAVNHAERHPSKTLGIIASHQSSCIEILMQIQQLLEKSPNAIPFFMTKDPRIKFYVKTPERAVDRYRDVVLVCAEPESGASGDRKIAVCTTLAKSELHVFISEADLSKQVSSKANLFWDWIYHLQNKTEIAVAEVRPGESLLRDKVIQALQAEKITVEPNFANGGISVGPVAVDANNSKRFLVTIEDDCTKEKFRETIEDREYIRPTLLKQMGWKILSVVTPFWYTANADEIGHLVATIAIEQSVAPPPPEEDENETDEDVFQEPELDIVPYQVSHPKIEGTPHDKPIMDLPASSLITQLKFYVDHEGPIHEELLLQRILELHHVDRAGPMLMQALTDAVKLGFQNQRFIKTGKFFYSIKNSTVVLRNRGQRPQNERKLSYVSPEERALIPSNMDEQSIKQTLGLLE